METLVFVGLAPLALLLIGTVAVVAWGRRGTSGARSLAVFSALSAGWLVCDVASLLAPTPQAAVRFAQATLLWAPMLSAAWLSFLFSYTDRLTPRRRAVVGGLALWCLLYGTLTLTNDAHGLVWASWDAVRDGPFFVVEYAFTPFGWAVTIAMWVLIASSLGVVVWTFVGGTDRDRDLSWWIVAGALVPLAANVAHYLSLGPIGKDFSPIAMAASAAAFGLGLVRYQFLDLRPIARTTLMGDLREGVLVLDARDRVVDANPAFRRTFGDGAAVIGRPLSEGSPALAESVGAAADETLRVGEGDGARYLDLRVSTLTDRAGAVTGRLVLLHDVTRRRRERAELRRANADLYDANAELRARNEELDAFAHTVAHDLKNSIQGVLGWAQVLEADGPDLPREAHREAAGQVVRSAQKMGDIVHELLLLAGVRQAEVAPAPVPMGRVLGEALARVGRSAESVGLRDASAWPVAVGHGPWVEEIWANYLSNAAKYGGPTVTVGAEATAAGQARFWVHDDGPGLSPEAQARLFVPFSRVGTREVEGHGLGLSIVRRIAERLGGTCGVESAPGAGTRFWFALPLAAAPEGAAPRALAA